MNTLEMDLFYIVLLSLLLMAGDVETNPGPFNKGTFRQCHFVVVNLASSAYVCTQVIFCRLPCEFNISVSSGFLTLLIYMLNMV